MTKPKQNTDEEAVELNPIEVIQQKMMLHANIIERLFNETYEVKITIIANAKNAGEDPVKCVFVTGEDDILDVIPVLKREADSGLWTPRQ